MFLIVKIASYMNLLEVYLHRKEITWTTLKDRSPLHKHKIIVMQSLVATASDFAQRAACGFMTKLMKGTKQLIILDQMTAVWPTIAWAFVVIFCSSYTFKNCDQFQSEWFHKYKMIGLFFLIRGGKTGLFFPPDVKFEIFYIKYIYYIGTI